MVQSWEVSFSLCLSSPELQATTRGKSGVVPTEQVTGAAGGVGEPISPPVCRRRDQGVEEKSNPGALSLGDFEGLNVASFRKTSSSIFSENNQQIFKKKKKSNLFPKRSNVETV